MPQSAKELLHSELMAMSDEQADELFRNFMAMKIAEFQSPSAEVKNDDENWEKYNDENDWEQPDECCVCFELTSQKTNCNHSVCYSCMIKMTSCPLCRGELIMPKNTLMDIEYDKKIKSYDRIGLVRGEIKVLKPRLKMPYMYQKDEVLRKIQICEERILELQLARAQRGL